MRFLSLALSGLLLSTALPSLAQTTTDAAPVHRFYVGLGAYHSNYQNLAMHYGETGFRVPIQLTAGYQLRPRVALELSAAYSGRSRSNASDGVLFNSAGTSYSYSSNITSTTRTTTVSALARYTLTRQPAHRLQFDVLGGLGVVHSSDYYRGSTTSGYSGSPETVAFAEHSSANTWLLTAGLAARYRLGPRVDVNVDLATNLDLTNRAHTYPNSSLNFIGSTALGLRYRFGS